MTRPNYSFVNLKHHDASEGLAYVGTLTLDGKEIAKVEQSGRGGEAMVWWLKPDGHICLRGGDNEGNLKQYLATLPGMKLDEESKPLPWDIGMFVDCLADNVIVLKKIKRDCKKKLCFLGQGKKLREGYSYYSKTPYSPAAAVKIKAQQGAIVLNELDDNAILELLFQE